jgi:hypothetical protein
MEKIQRSVTVGYYGAEHDVSVETQSGTRYKILGADYGHREYPHAGRGISVVPGGVVITMPGDTKVENGRFYQIA